MTRQTDWVDYEARLLRVVAYIHDHIEEDIDLDQLAAVACLSPYHWHRIYPFHTGRNDCRCVDRCRVTGAL